MKNERYVLITATLRRCVDYGLVALSAALLASMLVGALHDVCRDWDAWYYHLPFAARVAGIVSQNELSFSPTNQAHFDGFPLLGELIQGLLWKMTGHLQAANLLAFACVPLLAWLLRRRFGVGMHLTCLALFAVPLVQIHATSCYVDLPGNTAMTALLLLVLEAYVRPTPPGPFRLFSAACLAALAINTKLLLQPAAAAALVALAARALPLLRIGTRGQRAGYLLAAVLIVPVVFATPLKNAVLHANPFYPERLTLLGHVFPGTESPYSSSPRWLAHAPQPLRFGASVLELGRYSIGDARRWSIDQFSPPGDPGYRMGGFFSAYVVFQLAALTWFALAGRSSAARKAAIAFGAVTAFTSILPQSHELRYYLFWMMTLVCVNLWLARQHSSAAERALGIAALFSLSVVIYSTRAAYVHAGGIGEADLVRTHVDPTKLYRIRPGEKVCAHRQPYAFAWAPLFHRPLSYSLKLSEDPAGCGQDYRPLD